MSSSLIDQVRDHLPARTRAVLLGGTEQECLLRCLAVVPDPRDRRGIRHELPGMLAMAAAAVRLVWADGGYAGKLVDWTRDTLHMVLRIVKRSDDMTGFVVLPRRWVVERTLAWITRHRRCARDYETLPAHHEAMVRWAMIRITSQRLAKHRNQP